MAHFISMDTLHRQMYTEQTAADLLRVAPGTLRYWLEGGTRRGKTYKPVIREQPTGTKAVTWAEFVEAGLLREYRRRLGIPMAQLRDFITRLRDELGVPYPLAHERPWTYGKDLMARAQDASGLEPDFQLVAIVRDQPMLLPPAEKFLGRVRFLDDVAATWRPDDYSDSPVIIDPNIRFGLPTVHGIRTETLWEQSEAGEDIGDLAEMYELKPEQVRRAIAYEMATRAA